MLGRAWKICRARSRATLKKCARISQSSGLTEWWRKGKYSWTRIWVISTIRATNWPTPFSTKTPAATLRRKRIRMCIAASCFLSCSILFRHSRKVWRAYHPKTLLRRRLMRCAKAWQRSTWGIKRTSTTVRITFLDRLQQVSLNKRECSLQMDAVRRILAWSSKTR